MPQKLLEKLLLFFFFFFTKLYMVQAAQKVDCYPPGKSLSGADSPPVNSELTQQDGRKKRTAKHLYVANMTGLLLTCFVIIFTWGNVFWSFTKKTCLKEGEDGRKRFSNKIVTLVTQGLPSSFLSCPVA